VGTFIRAAHIVPRDGHLLSARSHTVIPVTTTPARFRLDGIDATASTPVPYQDAVIDITNGHDEVEATTTLNGIPVPAPTPAAVERVLWHAGTLGTASGLIGQVSGEVVSTTVTKPPVAATVVTTRSWH